MTCLQPEGLPEVEPTTRSAAFESLTTFVDGLTLRFGEARDKDARQESGSQSDPESAIGIEDLEEATGLNRHRPQLPLLHRRSSPPTPEVPVDHDYIELIPRGNDPESRVGDIESVAFYVQVVTKLAVDGDPDTSFEFLEPSNDVRIRLNRTSGEEQRYIIRGGRVYEYDVIDGREVIDEEPLPVYDWLTEGPPLGDDVDPSLDILSFILYGYRLVTQQVQVEISDKPTKLHSA